MGASNLSLKEMSIGTPKLKKVEKTYHTCSNIYLHTLLKEIWLLPDFNFKNHIKTGKKENKLEIFEKRLKKCNGQQLSTTIVEHVHYVIS